MRDINTAKIMAIYAHGLFVFSVLVTFLHQYSYRYDRPLVASSDIPGILHHYGGLTHV